MEGQTETAISLQGMWKTICEGINMVKGFWYIEVDNSDCPNLRGKLCNRKYDVNRPEYCSEEACPIKVNIRYTD